MKILSIALSFTVFLFLGFAQSQGESPILLEAPVDPLRSSETLGSGDGALVVQAKSAMIPGGCEFRKRVGGLVKVYQICAFSKIASMKAWEQAFEESRGGAGDFILSLEFTYNVGGPRAAESFDEAFKKISSRLSPEATLFLNFVRELPVGKGSHLELYFGRGLHENSWLVARFEGPDASREYLSSDKDFAKNLASVWLGAAPVDEKIRSALIK